MADVELSVEALRYLIRTYVSPDRARYRVEAAKAVETIYRDEPDLEPNGFRTFRRDLSLEENEAHFEQARARMRTDDYLDQVATALAYIDVNDIIKTPKFGSYGLKHEAERWGSVNGFAPYVCNGAFIVAALFRGVPYHYDWRYGGPNCYFALSAKTVRRLDIETRACLRLM